MPSPSTNPSSEIPLRKFNPLSNPYPAKKPWPPDLSRMDSKHQFRLERRYRRRSQIAYLRPTWMRRVKLAQYTAIVGVVAYAVLGIDWETEGPGPFASIRQVFGIEQGATPFDKDNARARIEETVLKRQAVSTGDKR